MKILQSFGLALLLGGSSVASAQSVELHRMQERLENAHERLMSGVPASALLPELAYLHATYGARVTRIAAELDRTERLAIERGLGAVAFERIQRARDAFEQSHMLLLEGLKRLAEAPDAAELEACIRALEPLAEAEKADLLSTQELPLRDLDLTPAPLEKGGPQTTTSFAVDDVDEGALADTIGTVPEPIRDLAETVTGALEAYELVKNQTRFEAYHGSMKGSVQTLFEGSGNDADINRLLVDLLRAKGIPARYVHGVVRLSIDQAANLLGVDDPVRIEQALAAAAIPYAADFGRGRLAAIEKDHVWVEAYVPWANYRGVSVDTRGRRWVPLDASFKSHTVDEGHRVLEEMNFDAEAFVREALEAPSKTDPLATLRTRVSQYLSDNVPSVSFDDALREVLQTPEVYGVLPASLPYEVISVNDVAFDFPVTLEHQMRIVARRKGQVFLDSVLPVPRVIGRRLTLSYVPAERDDRDIAESFGSLYLTPPYLLRVRPVLRSAGLVIATGGPIDMGAPFELESSFFAPAGDVSVTNRMIAGAYAALAVSGRGPGYEEEAESLAGEILNQRALNYLTRWNAADRDLSGLTRVLTFRPLPSHVVVKNAIHVEYANDDELVPLTFEWKGIQVDADLRPTAPVFTDPAGGGRRDFFFLSGLIGSELEGRVLEEDLGIHAVSTVELLRLGAAAAVERREIDRDNVDTELGILDLSAELEDGIAAHAHLGRIVQAPVGEIAYFAWTGAGFAAWDPVTGESAYMLSGRIAGGTSTDDPDDLPDDVRGALEDPDEPISERSRIVSAIEKVDSSHLQETLVDREALLALEVIVYDADGELVADGVPVTFTAVDEGSLLQSEDFVEEGTSITVPTQRGRARARFRVGTSTAINPRFVLENFDDEFLTQVGSYRVSVEAGGVVVEDPFVTFALPDAEKDDRGRHGRLKLVWGGRSTNLPLVVDNIPLWVEVVDRFSNPLSNLPVDWRVIDAERFTGIREPLPDVFQNAAIWSEDAEDYVDQARQITSYLGARTFMRLGDVDATTYRATATTDDSKYPGGPIHFARDARDFGAGNTKLPIGERLIVLRANKGVSLKNGAIHYESNGRNLVETALTMGPAGGLLPVTVDFSVQGYQETYEPVLDERGKWFLEGRGRFTRRDIEDATVTPLLQEGSGSFLPPILAEANEPDGAEYQFGFLFGPEAGMRLYGYSVEAMVERPYAEPNSGEVKIDRHRATAANSDDGSMIFGVQARLLEQDPDPFLVDGSSHLASGSTLAFEILPAVVDEVLARETLQRVIEVYRDGTFFAFGALPPSSPLTFNTILGYDPDRIYEARLALMRGSRMELISEPRRLQFFSAFMKGSKPAPILAPEVPDEDDPTKTKRVTTKDALLEYFIRKTRLPLKEAFVELYEVDRSSGRVTLLANLAGGPDLEGDGKATLPRGFEPKPLEKEYMALLNVTPEGRPGIRSRSVPVVFTRLLHDVTPSVQVTLEEGTSEVCFTPGTIFYQLDAAADVVISVMELDAGRVLTERVVFRATLPRTIEASHAYTLGPDALLNTSASHAFRIVAKAVDEPELEEQFVGGIAIQTSGNTVLPVGHTFVKGVDLFDGHLVSSSTDFSVPGRGPALELVRTYGSRGNEDKDVMGAGWALNYYSTLEISPCGWTVVGGEGTGQRFTQVNDKFVPPKGYHTELVQNGDGSYDFFTKGRIRYRYRDVESSQGFLGYDGKPTLEFIEDPNGNRLEIVYDGERNIVQVKEVFEGVTEGRSLLFDYEDVRGRKRLSRVTGPLGFEVSYTYDEYANLVMARRGERVERYEYDVSNLLDRHNLTAYTDPNGNRTRYHYYRESDRFAGEVDVEPPKGRYEWVRKVEEPEGTTTSFVYDVTNFVNGEMLTTVTDARRNETRYTLNLNGSPLRIEEPGDVVTTMTWAANDIYKESETDANGRRTEFRYDDRANLVEEKIFTSDRGEVVTEFDYEPTFNKMTSKRVHNGAEVQLTRFDINPTNGNLERVVDAEGNETTYEYFANGDLQFVRGPRSGQVSAFAYDEFGNPATTVDPEGNTTTTVYDERSRLTSSSDTMGRSMAQVFDELDRVTQVTRTDTKSSSDTQTVVRDYYPGGQLRSETNGLNLRTSFTLDRLNRVVGTTDTLGHTTSTLYDGNGNVVASVDRRGVTTRNQFDALNRLTRVEVRSSFGPVSVVSTMGYDAVGNKLFEIDLYGSRTDFEYDGLYRVERRRLPTFGPSRHEERFTYDDVGNKLSETDANGNQTLFGYDALNRLVSRVDAEANRVELEYDASGNVTLENDRTRNLRTTTVYDFLNRPTSRVVTASAPDGFSYETSWEYFDNEHRVVETDPRRFTKTTILDGFDRVHEVLQETGTETLRTQSFYDGNGNLVRTLDGENRETRFVYDGLNRLKETEDALGQKMSYQYDGEGNKTQEIDRRGVTSRFFYDPLGRMTRSELEQPLSGKGTLTTSTVLYDDATRRRIETDAKGNRTTFSMDERERVVEIVDTLNQVQRFVYDGVNKIEEVDKRANRTRFTYDRIHRLVEVQDALNQRIETDYQDSLRRVVETDQRRIEKTTQLDALGRLVSVTRAGVLLEQHQYDGNNNRTLSTDANGNRTQFAYDGANRLTARTDGLGSDVTTTTSFLYDKVGNLLEEKDGRATGWSFDVQNTYDLLNRLVTSTDGEDNLSRFEYDAEGNRTRVVEPKSEAHVTVFTYGELNELLSVTMPDRGVYTYEYDNNRNRTKQTDGEGNVVTFFYDRLNRLQHMTQDPGGLNFTTRHEYDKNGNETLLTDPKGQKIDFEYDSLNRLQKKTYQLTPADFELYTRTHEISYHYDENDNLQRVDELKSTGTDPPRIVSSFKGWDSLDRLTSETDASGRRLSYGYDNQGNRASLTDPDNKTTTFAYDELNRLETLTFDDGQDVTYEYFPDGLKSQVTNPNGTTSTYQYDAADRMTDITHLGPTGTVSAYQYTYDENGNREEQVETNAGRTETTLYDYDFVNRLKKATYPEKTVAYEYDPAGNRTRETTTGAEPSDKVYAYDAINRLLSIDSDDDTEDVAYQYDPNGNTTQKTKAGVTTTFHYDIRDQLGEVRESANVLGRYGFDYQGRRILKIGNEGRRQYTYDQQSVITEADPANATVSKYDYGLDQLVRLDNRGEGRSFFHLDILRSTVSLTDAAGGARQSIFYDAWGNERERIGASANNFTFTGHELDEETGLIYAKARFYDADTGRFLTQDDVLGSAGNPPSLSRYSYAQQNPLLFIDPTGHVAILQNLRKNLKDLKQNTIDAGVDIEASDEFGGDPLGTGVHVGFLAGIVGLADTALGAANTAANVAVVWLGGGFKETEFVVDSVKELVTVGQDLSTMAKVVEEEGLFSTLGQVGWSGAKSGATKVFVASQGDVRAIAEITAFGTEVGGEILLGSAGASSVSRAKAAGEVVEEIAEAGARRSTRVVRSARDVIDEAGPIIPVRPNESLPGANRGLSFVTEPRGDPSNLSAKMKSALDFDDSTTGAFSDVVSGERAVPALRLDNPSGVNFTKFDGFEVLDNGSILLIDRKTAIFAFTARSGPFLPASTVKALRTKSLAISQNPGFKAVIEVPNSSVLNQVQDVLMDLNITNLRTRVAQ